MFVALGCGDKLRFWVVAAGFLDFFLATFVFVVTALGLVTDDFFVAVFLVCWVEVSLTAEVAEAGNFCRVIPIE